MPAQRARSFALKKTMHNSLFTSLRMINCQNGRGMSIPTDIKVGYNSALRVCKDPCCGIENMAKYTHCPAPCKSFGGFGGKLENFRGCALMCLCFVGLIRLAPFHLKIWWNSMFVSDSKCLYAMQFRQLIQQYPLILLIFLGIFLLFFIYGIIKKNAFNLVTLHTD